ncbi:MAG: alpha/beta hydrolase [Bacteroidota bacterium]
MIRLLALTVLFFQLQLSFGQTSLEQIDLTHGKYKVGFQHYTTSDETRTYTRINDYTNQKIARPISVSIWYPSSQNTTNIKPLSILNYFEVLKEEEEWEYLPNEQLLNWFYYYNTPENQAHLKEETQAFFDVDFAQGKFPTLIYTPSLHASSVENFALCEYLASHGYVVISSPSKGSEYRRFNNPARGIDNQAKDTEFLIAEVKKVPIADRENMAIIAFSFGGLSNMILQMRNENIKAIVSLDGTERYRYGLLEKSPYFNLDRIDVPYIHMAQKNIPDNVLKEDKMDADINSTFDLYDKLTRSQVYKLKFNKLTHLYFSSMGVLFQNRDPRQDKSDAEIMESYKWVSNYTLNFLNAFLKKEADALKFMENDPIQNGATKGLISKTSKQAEKRAFNVRDFNDLARAQNYEDLLTLYEATMKKHPSLEIPEGALNGIGLQLVFNPKTSKQGIDVFLFATKLYPNSSNLYDSLAEAYLFLGDKKNAIVSFEKALELDASNQNASTRLQQLKK